MHATIWRPSTSIKTLQANSDSRRAGLGAASTFVFPHGRDDEVATQVDALFEPRGSARSFGLVPLIAEYLTIDCRTGISSCIKKPMIMAILSRMIALYKNEEARNNMKRKAIKYFGVGGAIISALFAASALSKDNPFEPKGAVPSLPTVLGDVVLKNNATAETYAPAEDIIRAYEPVMSALKNGIVGANRSAHSEVTVFLSPKLAQTKSLLLRSISERLTLDGIPVYIRSSAKDGEGGVTLEDWGPTGITITGSGRFHAVPHYVLSELQDLSDEEADFSRSPIHGKAITRPSVGIRAKHPAGYLP